MMNILLGIIILSVGYFCFTVAYDLRIRYNNRNVLNNISGINKDCADRFELFISDIEKETSWKVEIISGLRSKEAQIQLKRENPRNAAVNKSRHVLGRAVDLNLYKLEGFQFTRLKKSNSKASWLATKVPEIAKKYGLLWGGTYKNYHDPVHFEVN
ncbi:MAG: M15 family metallopeptidase [Mariniphaga sp.]